MSCQHEDKLIDSFDKQHNHTPPAKNCSTPSAVLTNTRPEVCSPPTAAVPYPISWPMSSPGLGTDLKYQYWSPHTHTHTLLTSAAIWLRFFRFYFFPLFLQQSLSINYLSPTFFPFFDVHTHTVTEIPRFGGDWGCVQRVSGKIQIFRSFFTTFSGYVGGDGGSCRADVGCVCGIGDKPKLNGHSHWYVVSSWLRIHWTELKCHYYPCTLKVKRMRNLI